VAALALVGTAAADDAPPEIAAKSAIAVQAETGDIVYARDESSRRAIASTTKLMTGLLVLERLKLSDVVSTVPYRSTAGESVVGFAAGERLTVADLLRALLLPSANDAAESLAVAVAGSRKGFVAEMNERARQLGLRDTHYENPIGLDSKSNYSSAADLVALTLELRRYPFFVQTTDAQRLQLRTGARPRTLVNRNLLLGTDPETDGVKTGHTSRAGYVLVGSARRDGVTVISVVLGEPSEAARDADSRGLLDYALARYERVAPVVARRGIVRAAIADQGGDRVTLVPTASVRRIVRRGAGRTVTTEVTAPDQVRGPLPAGAKVGTVTVREAGRVVARVPLVTAAAVPRASLFERGRALLGRTSTVVVLLALVIGSLTYAAIRRRDLRGRGAGEAKAQ
jgi:D-alanyl-D-alanine carboxypeptidase (penicillin-binding protein 5/6)